MTVKVTQLTLTAMIVPEPDDYDIEISNVFLEVLGDAPPYDPGSQTEFGPQDSVGISPGGLDVHFEVPTIDTGEWVALGTNVAIYDGTEDTGPIELIDPDSRIRIENRSGDCWINYQRYPSELPAEERKVEWVDLTKALKVRINYHENHVTVYFNGAWAHTYSTNAIIYPDDLELYLISSEGKTLSDVRVTELHDWRHGVFTETEADGASILQTIIQERPVEIYANADGTLDFYYNVDPDPQTIYGIIRRFKRIDRYNPQAASDLILYYRDVATYVDTGYLDDSGFITKILRLPGLDNGAKFAAKITARRMREREDAFEIFLRPDFSLEGGDVVNLVVTESGNGTEHDYDIFLENVSFTVKDGQALMVLSGRKHEP